MNHSGKTIHQAARSLQKAAQSRGRSQAFGFSIVETEIGFMQEYVRMDIGVQPVDEDSRGIWASTPEHYICSHPAYKPALMILHALFNPR